MTTAHLPIFLILTALSATSQSLPIHVPGGRPIVSGVYINGHGPYRFLIDTGAESSQLDARLASQIALRPNFRVEIATANGTSLAQATDQAEIRVGSAVAPNQEVLFTSLEGVRRLSKDIDGVLGQSFLSHFDYTLDFRTRTLSFGSATPTLKSFEVPFTLIANRPAIETSHGLLVLDSGAADLILFQSPSGTAAHFTVTTASGASSFAQTSSSTLKIGSKKLSTSEAVLLPAQPGTQESGLLPARTFARIHVANSAHRLTLD